MTKSATRIQDKDTQKRLSVVQSTEDPTKYWVVILNPDGSKIRWPQWEPWEAATVEVGSTTTWNPWTNASVENSGSSSHAILNFTIPRGDKWDTGTISVGTTTTGQPGTSASVTNSWTSTDAVFNFTIPKWDKWDTGDAATIQVGTTTTGSAGTNASVSNSGTTSNAIFNFVIPRGDKWDTWDTGNGIINTVKNKVWKVTTVTFTYANGNTFDFSVSDGKDWEGSGDVLWPSSSSDWHLALFDGNTGKLLKNGGAIQDNLTTDVSTDVLSAKQGKVLKDSVDTINGKIPSAATTSNQLADKDFVNSSINSVAAYYITKDANGDQFATYSELESATTFYSGGVVRVPTRNDYCIVASDENHDNATTRYIYQWNQWEYQYTVNETALTSAQLNALNSWITSGKVSTYDGYATTIAWKQDKLIAGNNIQIASDGKTISATDTTYNDATQSTAWLMSASDKTKLDGIASGAQVNTITGVKGNAESTYRVGNVNITPANIWITNKAAASWWTEDSLVTTWDKYNWNNKADTSIVNNTAYWSSWDWDSTHAPSKDAVYDKLKDLTDNKQDKLVNQTNIKSINGNSLLWSGDLEIAGWHDYSWKTKTWASFKIDLRSYIEPSQNFTVNLPDELEDGMEYVLRCVNGATAYTMTLGTGFTNPRNVSLSLNSYASDQFVFVAINGELELQPEPQLK